MDVRAFVSALLDALAPPLCVLCRGPPGAVPWLCGPCLDRLDLVSGPLCLRCGAPRPLPAPLCAACPDWPRRLVAARSAAPHHGTARQLVGALKYRSVLAAARPLGHLAAAAAAGLPLGEVPAVVPVPLHPRKRRQRGFNQAAEIGRVVARELGLPFRPGMLRRVRADPSSVYRSPSGRQRAVRGAFRARPGRGGPVLLVDDVLTTGATLGACARALGRRGVRDVWAVTATRAR